MIARVWDGETKAEQGDEYTEYLRGTGVAQCLATEGNRGVYVLRRAAGQRARFRFVSLWDSMDAIRRCAGSEPEKARYSPEDERFLLVLSPEVEHYEVAIASERQPSAEAASLAEELRTLWHGDAWHGPALVELLAGVTAEQAARRGITGGHSIWELVLHIGAWSDAFRRRLEGESVDEPEQGDFPAPGAASEQAWAAAKAQFESTQEALAERVERLTAPELEETTPGRPFSKRFLVRMAIRHVVYHSGQIGLLKKGAS